MEMEILGSGTSHGIPVIGCTCPVCASLDPHDNRMRASALVRCDDGTTILIDVGPEFRIQALRAKIDRLDAILLTHSHADHVHGLDDIRIFSREKNIPIYADKTCLTDIRERFSYIFKQTQEGGGKPHVSLIEAPETGVISIGAIEVMPIPLGHGKIPILGWRIGDTAYLTDCNFIPEESILRLKGIKNLVIDSLRLRSHSTHFNFTEALVQIEKIKPDFTWFTHICHDYTHTKLQKWLAANAPGKKIEPAFDGLLIRIECR